MSHAVSHAGAFMEKGLSMAAGQTPVQKYWKQLLGMIQARLELSPFCRDQTHDKCHDSCTGQRSSLLQGTHWLPRPEPLWVLPCTHPQR